MLKGHVLHLLAFCQFKVPFTHSGVCYRDFSLLGIYFSFLSVSSGCWNKQHRIGGFKSRYLFLIVLEAGGPRSRYQPTQLLLKRRFLVFSFRWMLIFRWMLSSILAQQREIFSFVTLLIKDTNPTV